MVSDEILAAKAKTGTQEAFEELVKRYRALVYYVVSQAISDPQEAEDVVQEVFESVFRSISAFNPRRATFKTWLFIIVKHRCIDWLRRSRKAIPIDELGEDGKWKTASQPENAFEVIEFKDAIKRAFVHLSDEQKMCLALQSIEGFSYKEIAGVMGVPIGTVRSRIASARKKLLGYLSDTVEDDTQCGVTK